MIRLTGMWKREQREGSEPVFIGNIGSGKVVMLANGYKANDNDPDYILYIKEKEEKEEKVVV